MPTAPLPPCTTPLCPKRAEPNPWNLQKCATHAAERARHYKPRPRFESNEDRREYRRMYGPRWRSMRDRFIERYPWCEHCGRPATDVDHVIPLTAGGSREWANLQSLCHSCHSKKTYRENPPR